MNTCENRTNTGLYIHVPFCKAKCPYCDFYSVVYDDATADSYTRAVCRAIADYPNRESICVDSVYFGGGTPTLLGGGRLVTILGYSAKYFHMSNPEISLEANPNCDLSLLPDLAKAGFNRISFGVQSACDNELAALGRSHSAKQAETAILKAKSAGFDNISADIMLGIPHQTTQTLERTVQFLSKLPLSHISAYMLKIEPATPFFGHEYSNLCPNEDDTALLYESCVRLLHDNQFMQYEISNFAKPDCECRHNLKYWNCEDYIGIGPAAHSFMGGVRSFFPRDIAQFIAIKNPLALSVKDGAGGDFEEYAMLKLRLNEGLDTDVLQSKYTVDSKRYLQNAKKLKTHGLVRINGTNISLTTKGFLLSNSVTASILYD